jgi:perosamine synthetase
VLAQEIVARLCKLLPPARPVPLHEPSLGGNESLYLQRCVETGWVSYLGPYVTRFEQSLTEFTGSPKVVSMASGTAALHLALVLLETQAGDEVLLPSLSFVATANAVAYCGAVPHFVDVDEKTLGIDVARLAEHLREHAVITEGGACNRRSGRRIRTLIAVHSFGHVGDLEGLAKLCAEYRLSLVEDACESLGSFYRGRHSGTFGRIGVLSFNGNKIVTTGGGGAIITPDSDLGERARHLSSTARLPHPWEHDHDAVGYNYRLSNLGAAVGVAQMEQLPGFLAKKKRIFAAYRSAFAGLEGARVFAPPPDSESNHWLSNLLLAPGCEPALQGILELAHRSQILLRPAWKPLHRLAMFRDAPRMNLDRTEDLAGRLVSLPSSAGLLDT